jgi:O-antigen ligase
MNREGWDRWCERGILILVLAIMVLGPLALGAVRNLEFAVIQVLTLGVLGLWVLRLWLDPRPRLLWPPICWAVLAFTVYAVARYLYADVEYIARLEMIRVLVYAILFVAILNNLHRQETIQVITFSLLVLATVISFYAIYQFLTGTNRVWTLVTSYPHRGSGTYFNPNHLGGFLEMLLPLGLAFTLTARIKPVVKVFLGYASLAVLAGIGVTVSKGSWISTSLALAVFFGVLIFRRNYRVPALMLLVLMVGGCVFLFPKSVFFRMRIKQTFTQSGNVNDELRYSVWRPALRMWQDNPWWGVGPGLFNTRFRAYRPEGIQVNPEYTHNDYLNSLADWGAIGTGLVACAWVLLAFGVWKTWSSVRLSSGDLGGKSGSNKFAFVFGASVGLIAILLHSVVDFNMHIPANAILAIALMALISSHLRFATESFWFRVRLPLKVAASCLALAAFWYLGSQAWRQTREFVLLKRAAGAPNFSAAKREILVRAFAVEPMNSETAYDVGEAFRRQSQEGGEHYEGQEGVNYRQLAERAIEWFGKSIKLNPWDSRPCAGYGWCLDWLGRQAESGPYFSRAEELDPNNYYNVNNIGLHYVQLNDYAAAKPWFERSMRLSYKDNPIAQNYFNLCIVRMEEAATNEITAKLNLPSH